MDRGHLIAIEGIDGAGKSTLSAAIAERLRARGRRVVETREPTQGPYGRQIRATAHGERLPVDEELQLFVADRREHVDALIRPQLEAGTDVLVDRYYYSTAAYQGARGLDPDEIIAMNEAFAPRPDLLVLLDLPAEVGLARVKGRGAGADQFEKLKDLQRCREIFLGIQGDHVLQLDASRATDALADAVVEHLCG